MGKLKALDNSKTDKGKMQISIKKRKEDKVLKFLPLWKNAIKNNLFIIQFFPFYIPF